MGMRRKSGLFVKIFQALKAGYNTSVRKLWIQHAAEERAEGSLHLGRHRDSTLYHSVWRGHIFQHLNWPAHATHLFDQDFAFISAGDLVSEEIPSGWRPINLMSWLVPPDIDVALHTRCSERKKAFYSFVLDWIQFLPRIDACYFFLLFGVQKSRAAGWRRLSASLWGLLCLPWTLKIPLHRRRILPVEFSHAWACDSPAALEGLFSFWSFLSLVSWDLS